MPWNFSKGWECTNRKVEKVINKQPFRLLITDFLKFSNNLNLNNFLIIRGIYDFIKIKSLNKWNQKYILNFNGHRASWQKHHHHLIMYHWVYILLAEFQILLLFIFLRKSFSQKVKYLIWLTNGVPGDTLRIKTTHYHNTVWCFHFSVSFH